MAGTTQSERRRAAEAAVLKRTKNTRASNKSRIARLQEADAPFDMIRSLNKKNKGISNFQDDILDPDKRMIEMTKEYRDIIPKAMGGYKKGGLVTKGKPKLAKKGWR